MKAITGLNVVAVFEADEILDSLGRHFTRNPLPPFLDGFVFSEDEKLTLIIKYVQDAVERTLAEKLEDVPSPDNVVQWFCEVLDLNEYDSNILKDFITDSAQLNDIIAVSQKLAEANPWLVLKVIEIGAGNICVVNEGDFRVNQWMAEHEVDDKYYIDVPAVPADELESNEES